MHPLLEVNDVVVAYNSHRVIHGVSFGLSAGAIGCLLGPSGCGKTTLLRVIAGFEPVQEGRVSLAGETVSRPAWRLPPERRRVGIVFQDYALFPHLTVGRNIGFGIKHWHKEKRSDRIHQLLELVGLSAYVKSYPHQLSGGQQQRVALARALAPKPKLLLLDEPFSSMDVDLREAIAREVRSIIQPFMKVPEYEEDKSFYAYVPLTQVHFPTLPHPDFAGVTGNGDFADSMVQTDHYVGELLDLVDELGVRDNTIFVFTSDNGPDPNWPHHGSAGPWSGYYFTHQEGSLRAPFIIRWPGKIAAGRVSNEIVHEMDTYVTFARIAGVEVPQDRAIDGVDQVDFFLGEQPQSNRDSVLAFVADRLEAVKWNDWKLELYERQRDWWTPPVKLGTPKLYNLLADPREEYPQTSIRNSWVAYPALERAAEFKHSLVRHPPIPTGTPDPYSP